MPRLLCREMHKPPSRPWARWHDGRGEHAGDGKPTPAQSPLSAIAPPCPALEREKRYPRALQGRVPWRQSRPRPHKALGLIFRLTDANPLRPRTSGAQMPRLLCESFFFGQGACRSPALRKNGERIPPEHTCPEIVACSDKVRIPHSVRLSKLAKFWRYALMIIASDNHAYRMLTPFAPVIRGHKCLFGATLLEIPLCPTQNGRSR